MTRQKLCALIVVTCHLPVPRMKAKFVLFVAQVLQRLLPPDADGHAIEVSSGTGQHVTFFSKVNAVLTTTRNVGYHPCCHYQVGLALTNFLSPTSLFPSISRVGRGSRRSSIRLIWRRFPPTFPPLKRPTFLLPSSSTHRSHSSDKTTR